MILSVTKTTIKPFRALNKKSLLFFQNFVDFHFDGVDVESEQSLAHELAITDFFEFLYFDYFFCDLGRFFEDWEDLGVPCLDLGKMGDHSFLFFRYDPVTINHKLILFSTTRELDWRTHLHGHDFRFGVAFEAIWVQKIFFTRRLVC